MKERQRKNRFKRKGEARTVTSEEKRGEEIVISGWRK